jgi:cupin fold WbuC family metalloprotein
MKKIDENIIANVVSGAKASPRKRMNRNFHENFSDPIQRFLNAWEPGSYLRPHRHLSPPKREVFIVLQGRFAVATFDDEGNILEKFILDPAKGNFAVELAAGEWHTVIPLETGSVAYELKDGPYDPIDDKDFAPWAPKEGEDGCDEYNRIILKEFDNYS